MAAYLHENLQVSDENLELIEEDGGIFQVMVHDKVVFDNRVDDGKFPEPESLLSNIQHEVFN